VPTTSRLGAVALIGFTVAGLVWFWLELAPQRLGFEDTDSPAVSLAFLRANAEVYARAGIALLVAGLSLIVSAIAVDDLLAPFADPLRRRAVSAIGLIAAACFVLHGVLRLGVRPLLYIDGLDRTWGEAGYVTIQLLGVHGFAQASILLLCAWIVGAAALGLRSRAIPAVLVLLAAIPGLRLLGLLGPLEVAVDGVWLVMMLAIPVSFVWPSLLGVVLWRRPPSA